MNFSNTTARPSARPSPFSSSTALRRLAVFAVLHLVLLAAMYGAAVVNARSHELGASVYGAGQTVHLGRMALYPVADGEARP